MTITLIFSCNPVKSKLNLNRKEFNLIKKESELINEINLSFKDSINLNLIKRRLDSFYLKKYTMKELISSIELDRVFKGANVEIDRSLHKDSVPNFDNVGEMKQFLKKVSEDFHKKKDSL
jgi:hypothetical protein